jgi:hypothetical protein
LPVSRPPKIERKTPGSAASHARLLAAACVNPNSPIKIGSNGGIDCIENKKATEEKTATKRFLFFAENRSQQP